MSTASPIDVTPSRRRLCRLRVETAAPTDVDAAAVGVLVCTDGPVPDDLGLDRSSLQGAGFAGRIGQTFTVARSSGAPLVAVGAGQLEQLSPATLRDAAAAFARAVPGHTDLALTAPGQGSMDADAAAQAAVEGALLARYRFDLRSERTGAPLPLA